MIAFLFLIATAYTQDLPADPYDIPAYYGHFSLRYLEPDYLLAGRMVRLEYHFAVDASYNNQTIFLASRTDHCVYAYSLSSQTVTTLVGQCGYPGNVVGSKELAKFNGISSLAYFRPPSPTL